MFVGVVLTEVVAGDGSLIFGIPCNADNVLKIALGLSLAVLVWGRTVLFRRTFIWTMLQSIRWPLRAPCPK